MMKGRNLGARITDRVRSGRLMPGIVVDVFFDRASVQLSGGPRLTGLQIIGGPIAAGDTVGVDFTTPQPTVVAQGAEGLNQDDLDAAIAKIAQQSVSQIPQIRICLFSGGTIVDMFDPTPEGLTSALAASNVGDIVLIPDIDADATVEVPSGVSLVGLSSRQSIIRGTITLNTDCSLERLCVISALKTTGEVNAVIAQGAGDPSYIKECEIHAYNCSSGLANAIKISSTTDLLEVVDSVVVGDSKNGANAHAFTGTGGECRVVNCRLYSKSADHFDGTTFYVNSNIGHVTELERACMLPNDTDYLSAYGYGTLAAGHAKYYGAKSSNVFTPAAVMMYSTTNPAPGPILRKGDYIYFQKHTGGNETWIREWKISDGTYLDLKVINTQFVFYNTPMCIVDDRKLLVAPENTGSRTIYMLNFSTMASLKYYEFDTDDNPTGTTGHYHYRVNEGVATYDENGDLHVVFMGEAELYSNVQNQELRKGMYWLSKNWSQDTEWVLTFEVFLGGDENVFNDSVFFNAPTQVVQGRYLITVPSHSTFGANNGSGGDLSPNGPTDYAAYIGFCVFDLTDGSTDTKFIKIDFESHWSDPTCYDVGADHLNGWAFANYNDWLNGSAYGTYKLDPVALTMTEVYRSSGNSADRSRIGFSKENIVAFKWVQADNLFHVLDLHNGTTELFTVGNFVTNANYHKADLIASDEIERIWYYKESEEKIYGLRVTDGDQVSMTVSDLPETTIAAYVRGLGNVFVVYIRNTSSVWEFWLVKESA